MSQPYLGEIRLFAGNFAPRNNAYCNGQLMNISQNSALFSLLGTTYGGNGTTTFGLPDFRGRVPVSQGQGNGLSNYTIGQQTGTETVTINSTTMPMHNHLIVASSNPGSSPLTSGHVPAALDAAFVGLYVDPANIVQPPIAMNAASLGMAGGTQPHENRMPAIAISMIIALQGIFPSRN